MATTDKPKAARFTDAKVLRCDDVTLFLSEIRMLAKNMELGEHSVKDLRTLTSIGDKLDEALGELGAELDSAQKHLNEVIQDLGGDSIEARDANKVFIKAAKRLDNEIAPDVILTLAEADWIRERWDKNTKLVGEKETRAKILRIDDVVHNMKGVRFVGAAKAAWIEGEPEPMVSPSEKSEVALELLEDAVATN